MQQPTDMDVAPSGRIFVEQNYNLKHPQILEFPPNANLNVNPASILLPQFPNAITAVEAGPKYLYVESSYAFRYDIDLFPLNAQGQAPAVCHIAATGIAQPGNDDRLLAKAPSGLLWVPLWAKTSSSYQPAIYGYKDCQAVPTDRIEGPHTGLTDVWGLAADIQGRLIVLDQTTNSILIFFSGNQNGNVTPNLIISGGNTGLYNPVAMTIY